MLAEAARSRAPARRRSAVRDVREWLRLLTFVSLALALGVSLSLNERSGVLLTGLALFSLLRFWGGVPVPRLLAPLAARIGWTAGWVVVASVLLVAAIVRLTGGSEVGAVLFAAGAAGAAGIALTRIGARAS